VIDKPHPDDSAPRSWMARLAEGLSGATFGRRPAPEPAIAASPRFCFHCGRQIEAEDVYCGKCGMRCAQSRQAPETVRQESGVLPPEGVAPSLSGAGRGTAEPQLWFCEECGTARGATDEFCGHYGRNVLPTDGAVPDPAPGDRSRFSMPANPSEGTTFSPSGPSDTDFVDDPPFLSRERPLTPLEEAAFRWWERTSVFSPWGTPRPSVSPEAAGEPDAASLDEEPLCQERSDEPSLHASTIRVDSGEAADPDEAEPWFQSRGPSLWAEPATPPADVAALMELAARENRGSAASTTGPSQKPTSVLSESEFPERRPTRPTGRWLVGVGTVMLAALAMMLAPRTRHEYVPAPNAAPLPGLLSVRIPAGIDPALLSATVMRNHQLAEGLDLRRLDQVMVSTLAAQPLRPGVYQLRFLYRKKLLAEMTAAVRASECVTIQPPDRELADIEYEAGLRSQGSPEEKGYFHRVLLLDPDHVNAHLQLAAYELVHGSRSAAERHLAAIRRLDPHNADAVALARLLRIQKNRRR
jgi:hypothetical protein